MADFDQAAQDMAATVPDATQQGADKKRPQELGWVTPTAFDYGPEDGAPAANPSTGASEGHPDWAHNAVKYEWKGEYGDVGPEVPELEQELFHNEYATRIGGAFDKVLNVQVVCESLEKVVPVSDLQAAGLHPAMASNVKKCGYQFPTPIQAYTIPAVLEGKDLIATSQTGSGKTAAFLIPTISKLMGKAKKLAAPRPNTTEPGWTPARAEPLVLVVAPTRELCCQIFDEARRLCYRSMLRPCVAYGGAPIREQRAELSKGCDVLIATPGRLLDFMSDTRALSMSRLRFTIIDEADEMLQADWEEEMSRIMGSADANEDGTHQYLLFSATFNKTMRKLAKKFLNTDHVRIRVGRSGAALKEVAQQIIFVERRMKQKALYDLLINMPPARTMIFVKSKKTADFVDDFLFNQGLPSTSIHSDRTQREREDAIRAFRAGTAPIIVTTGVSARGIDVRNVLHVVNFDLPSQDHNGEDEYIHRIGRTARLGNMGLATSFYNDDDEPIAEFLVKTLIECDQQVPEFLEQYKPEDGAAIDWNDDSGAEDEGDAVTAGGESGWGTGGGDAGGAWGGDNGSTAVTPAATPVADEWTNNTDNAGSGGGW